MGTFGTTIFSDDFACDIRDELKEFIGDGITPEQATSQLRNEYSDSLKDDDEASVFWLALAATQWKTGRLLDNVKQGLTLGILLIFEKKYSIHQDKNVIEHEKNS